MPSLDEAMMMMIIQAKKKGWNRTNKFLIEVKLPEEIKELLEAIESKDPEKMAKEFVDVFYIVGQIINKFDKKGTIDLDEVFEYIYDRNYNMKKKTQDGKGNWIRK